MGTLVAKLHEERRQRERAEARELPCVRRAKCARKWSGCEKVCGGYAPRLSQRR